MRIVSHRKLKEFYEQAGHEDARIPLERWCHTVEEAKWHSFAEMRMFFGTVDYVGNNSSLIFPVPKRPWR